MTETEPASPPPARDGNGGTAERLVRWALPLAVLVSFLATARGYGIFRDELYYVACGRHLDWGYVDHPPIVALLAALASALFPGSLLGLRSFPAIAFAATVLLVGDTTRAMGGGRWARLSAQLLTAAAPVYLGLFTVFSMNGFDVLVWAGLVRLASARLAGGDRRLWIAFGLLAGVGLETKLDVGLLGVGLGVGLLMARRIDELRRRELWLGAAVAALLLAPHAIWQAAHGWPTAEFVTNARAGKIAELGAVGFLLAQVPQVGPAAALAAICGLAWLLLAPQARAWRPLGWAAVAVLLVYAVTVSKAYYYAPAYTILFPAAGAALEQWTAGRFRKPARAAILVLVAATLVFAPLAKPLLGEDATVRYASALGVRPGSGETHELGRLPQFFADMHGWRAMAESVAAVHSTLSPTERAVACVFATNYGEAGAIDYFGPGLGLPPAISGHNSYWFWGPGRCTGQLILAIGGNRNDYERLFAAVEPGGVIRCDDCMPYESDRTIWIARGITTPLADVWPQAKHFD